MDLTMFFGLPVHTQSVAMKWSTHWEHVLIHDGFPITCTNAIPSMTFMLLAGRGQLSVATLDDQHQRHEPNVFIITSRQDVHSNSIDVKHLHSSQEEADTRIILYSLDAVQRGATLVFVLTIQWYQLCKDTYFITGVGNKKNIISLEPVVQALGETRTSALPGFHASSTADQTGHLAGKGKLTC